MAVSLNTDSRTKAGSKVMSSAGWLLTALSVLFLLLDGAMKVIKAAPVLKASAGLEIPEHVIPGLGAVLIFAALIYALPRTSLLGAIVLTGYLGGAMWTHIRMGGAIFPVIVAALIWGGLYLREPRLRMLLPLVREASPGSLEA